MRKDVVENLAEQEQRIANNSELISENKEDVETNEALVTEVKAEMEEQKRETASLLGGVFANLSGVLASAVSAGVKTNEAQVAEIKEKMKVKVTRVNGICICTRAPSISHY